MDGLLCHGWLTQKKMICYVMDGLHKVVMDGLHKVVMDGLHKVSLPLSTSVAKVF